MISIEELKQIKILDELINTKLQEIDNLRTMATKITVATDGERVQSSGSGDKVCNAVARIVDLQNEINDDVDRFVDLKSKILKELNEIKEPYVCDILYKRYFEYKTWETIASDLFFTRQWVMSIYKRFFSC